MKERGKKAVEMYQEEEQSHTNMFQQDYGVPCEEVQCKKHRKASSVGVCAECLKDRLVNLVCPDCGEQRLSSCSCSDHLSSSSKRNSCNAEVGSVGRISFLLENEQKTNNNDVFSQTNKSKVMENPDVLLLKRSSSSCVELKKKSGFWRIGRLFSRKREKDNYERSNSVNGFGEKSDLLLVDYMGVSRSRSLCSFRNGNGHGFFGSEDGTSFSGARSSTSAARSSVSAARSSGFNGGLLFDPARTSGFSVGDPTRKSGFSACQSFDPERKSTFSEGEPRKSGLDFENLETRRVFSLKEGNFSTSADDSGFIDLKFDFPSETNKPDFQFSGINKFICPSDHNQSENHDRFSYGNNGSTNTGDGGLLIKGGSCRITVNDYQNSHTEIKRRSRKSFKSWRWIFFSPLNSYSHGTITSTNSSKKNRKTNNII